MSEDHTPGLGRDERAGAIWPGRFVDAAPGRMALVDQSLRYLAASAQWREDWQLSAPVAGRPFDAGVLAPDGPEVLARCFAAGAPTLSGEQPIRLPAGRSVWVRWTLQPWRPAGTTVAAVVVALEDITAVKDAERRLHDEAQFMRLLLEGAAQGILCVDAPGTIVTANPALEAMFGWEVGTLTGERLEVLVPPSFRGHHATQHAAFFQAARTGTMSAVVSATGLRRNGTTFPIEVTLSTLPAAAGERAVAFVTDVTDRRRNEEALRESDERHAFLVRLGDALRHAGDQAQVLLSASRILGEQCAADGVAYWDVDLQDNVLRPRGGWTAAGQTLPTAAVPIPSLGSALAEHLGAGRPIAIADLKTDELGGRGPFARVGSGGVIAHPLMAVGRWVGVLAMFTARPRAWSAREIGLVREVAARTQDSLERAAAQEALRGSEARLRLALSAGRLATLHWDRALPALTCDDQPFQQIGCPIGTQGRTTVDALHALVHPDDREDLRAILRRALAAGGAFRIECRGVWPGDVTRWIEGRGHLELDPRGVPESAVGVLIDVTEVREAQQQLREGEQRLRLALEAASARAWTWDVRANRVELDTNLEAGLAPAAEPLVPGWRLSRVHPDDRARVTEILDAAQRDGGSDGWDFEYRVTSPNGGAVWYHSIGRVVRDAGGRAVRVQGISLDVTERMKAQAEIDRSHQALREHAVELEHRSAQLRRLASELTLAEHRTREALAKTLHDHLQQLQFSALLRVQRALTSDSVDPGLLGRARQDLQAAMEAARSLSVELSPPALRLGTLADALVWLGSWMGERYDLQVEVAADPAADPEDRSVKLLVFESVRELLFNAVKHAGAAAVDMVLAMVGDEIRITVADNGVGFDASAALGRWRAGEGLGLFGIRERLWLLGGNFHVDSTPGHGTRFTLIFPRGARPRRPQAPGAAADGPDAVAQEPLRILLVDSHALVREGLRELIEGHLGLLVVGEAATGPEALDRAADLQPDVVLIDTEVAGLDGVDVIRRLRAGWPNVAVLALTSAVDDVTRRTVTEAGAMDVLTKNDGAQRLIERLDAMRRPTV